MSVNHIYAIALSNNATAKPTWGISVQPKKVKRLFFHEHNQTVAFFGSKDGALHHNSSEITGEELLVKLLISENGIPNIEQRTSEALSDIVSSESSELWLKDAVNALQHSNLVDKFDVDAFVRMAGETLKSQQGHHESVAVEVDYLAELGRTKSVDEIHETRDEALKKNKKGGYFGFWISRPQGMPKKVRRVCSWERQDDPYGGMM